MTSTVSTPSGYANYDNIEQYDVINVQLTLDIDPYGRFGTRLNDVTVADGPLAGGDFDVYIKDSKIRAMNHGVSTQPYTTGIISGDMVLIREMNRHPDGEQMFNSFGRPFYLLVARPSETLDPKDVVLLLCLGDRPVYIHRNTWHQPPYSSILSDHTFVTEQAASHVCVAHDFINSDNCLVGFPANFISAD